MISLAAAATTDGVKRFSIPNWSVGPNLPHALPGGPVGSSGSDEKAGCGRTISGSKTSSNDMGLSFDILKCILKSLINLEFVDGLVNYNDVNWKLFYRGDRLPYGR